MASTHFNPSSVDAFWARTPSRRLAVDRQAAREVALAQDTRRRRRQRLVRAVGGAAMFGLGAFTAWIATSTQARDEVATWGTMGKITPVHLTESAPEDVAQAAPEVDLGKDTIAWAIAPPVALSSREVAQAGSFGIDDSTYVPTWHAGANPSQDGDVDVAPKQGSEAVGGTTDNPY